MKEFLVGFSEISNKNIRDLFHYFQVLLSRINFLSHLTHLRNLYAVYFVTMCNCCHIHYSQRRSGTSPHTELTVEIKYLQYKSMILKIHFETMIGDMIDTFKITTSAANQTFARKNQTETSTSHSVSYSSPSSVHHISSGYAILKPSVKETCSFYNLKINNYLRKRGRFWPFTLNHGVSDDVKKWKFWTG